MAKKFICEDKRVWLKDYIEADRLNNSYTMVDLSSKLGISQDSLRDILAGKQLSQLTVEKVIKAYGFSYALALKTFKDCLDFKKFISEDYALGEQEVRLVKLSEVVSKAGNKCVKAEFITEGDHYNYFDTLPLRSPNLSKFEKCFNINTLTEGINAINKRLETEVIKGLIVVSKEQESKYLSIKYKVDFKLPLI